MESFKALSAKVPGVLEWAIKGTKKNVSVHMILVNGAVKEDKQISWLAEKARDGIVDGDPHTTNRHGVIDPNHLSGIIGIGNLKKSRDRYSFHYYPEQRRLKFSDSDIPDIILPAEWVAGAEKECEELWLWDVKQQKPLRWDEKQSKYVEGFPGRPEDRPWSEVVEHNKKN